MPTLLEILQQRFPDSSATTLRNMLKSDRVLVNGKTERDAKLIVLDDDEVDSGSSTRSRRIDSRLKIVHEDDDLIVVDKPASLLTVADASEQRNTVEALLNSYFNGSPREKRVHVVHRLDRDTSGLLVFARNTFIRDRLQALFAVHDIERTYVAIVHGATPPAGTYRSFLAEDVALRVRSIANIAEGKEAITHFLTEETGPLYSRVVITLETGRRNQIRVHFAEAGHPVAGDTMYGREHDPVKRLALHATRLGFAHPRTRSPVMFDSPLPPELARIGL